MYPKVAEASLALATMYKKYKSLSVGGERYGSTAGVVTMESLTLGLCDLELFVILWFTVWK